MPRAKKGHRKDGRVQIKRVIGHDYQGQPINKWFSGKDKKEAEQKYFEYLNEIERKEQHKKQMPFEEWANIWLYDYKQNEVRPSTFDSTYYRPMTKHILPYFKGRILNDITQADIKRYSNTLLDFSQSMIDKIMLCLNCVFESACDNDIILKNPCRNLKVKSKAEQNKKRTYDKVSTEYLCSIDHKYGLAIHILLRMGLRGSELCALTWEKIDLENGIMHITEGKVKVNGVTYIGKPKSANSTRKLPIPNDLLTRLKNEQKTGGNLVTGHTAELSNKIYQLYRDVGIPKDKWLTPHELRHTCGTLLYQETKDIYHVSRFLGHSDIGITTKIYVHSIIQDDAIHIGFS
jgi:integrase